MDRSIPLIKILIIDGSDVMRKTLTSMLNNDPDIEVIGTSAAVEDALDKLHYLSPDVIALGLHASEPEAPASLYRLRYVTEAPLVVFGSALKNSSFKVRISGLPRVQLLDINGSGTLFLEEIQIALLEAIRQALAANLVESVSPPESFPSMRSDIVVVIGASVGGQNALQQIIPRFPESFPAAVLIAQESRPGFTKVLAERLDYMARMPVREAADGDLILPGEIKVMPGSQSVIAEEDFAQPGHRAYLRAGPFSGPGEHIADRLTGSLAAIYGPNVVGVLLTGLGKDGVAGLKAIKAAGGVTLVEDASTAVVFDLPGTAIQQDAANKSVPLWYMAEEIRQAVGALATRQASSLHVRL